MCNTISVDCSVITRSLLTNEEKVELTADRVQAIEWSPDGEILSYIDNSEIGTRLNIYDKQNAKEIFKFTPALGRGGGLDDEISLSFSPSGKYLLVVNTAVVPNTQQDNTTIWVFTKDGAPVDKVAKDYATDASWISNDTYVYRSKSDIFKRKITAEEEIIFTGETLDILTFSDNKYLVGWNLSYENENALTKTIVMSLDDKSTIYQKEDTAYPKLLDKDKIIALKTISDQSFLGFSTIALVKIDTQTNQITTLDSSPGLSNLTVITSQN